ncbi:MAG: glycosyltransferase [Myxococcota bacterium]
MKDLPAESSAARTVAIVSPVLNEASTVDRLAKSLDYLDPPPDEILLVDGGSTDGGDRRAEELGLPVLRTERRGRSRQINAGLAATASEYVCVLHADTELPFDAVEVIRRVLQDPALSLASFTPVISGPGGVRWMTTLHNWAKTWYAPLFFRPDAFIRGGRLLFGDHAMFFRRADFEAVGGFDPTMLVMEEADFCLKMCRRGRIRMINRLVLTSDRRLSAWGQWRANWVFLSVGVRWALGRRRELERHYPDVR